MSWPTGTPMAPAATPTTELAVMASTSLVLGYGWTDERPFLRVRDAFDEDSRIVELEGHFRAQVTGPRRCTGYFDGEVSHPCPGRRTVQRGTSCPSCQSLDAFRPCMTCDGTRCPRLSPPMRRYCRQDHHLYLACFGDATIKVGTASHPRRVRRIVEQGPLFAARVAQAEGPVIKQMERALSQGPFTETMRRSRKTALLSGAMSAREAEALVLDAADRLTDELPAWMHPHLHPPDPVAQPDLAVASRGLTVQPLEQLDEVILDGDVVGAVGHVVFLDDGDGVFALDLGDLKGRMLDWEPDDGAKKPVVQLGLF